MSPAEAGTLDLEEPDWHEVFTDACARRPDWPNFLRENEAFEETLKRWRRFHSKPIEGSDKRMPAAAVDGIIALAHLKIMAPRSAWREIERDGKTGYQHDEHCWLSIAGEPWRIVAVEDKTLCLEKMSFDDKVETKQIDLMKAKWNLHNEAAAALLKAMQNAMITGHAFVKDGQVLTDKEIYASDQ